MSVTLLLSSIALAVLVQPTLSAQTPGASLLLTPTAAAGNASAVEDSGYTAEALSDEVTVLPGWEKLDFRLFSGYSCHI